MDMLCVCVLFIEFSDSPPWRTDGMDGLAREVLDAGDGIFFGEFFGGGGVCGFLAYVAGIWAGKWRFFSGLLFFSVLVFVEISYVCVSCLPT